RGNRLTTSALSKLFIVTTPLLRKKMAFKSDTIGAKAFPSLGFAGGTIAGVPVLASDAVTSGDVLLIDASGFVASGGEIVLDNSRQADIQFETSPDSPPTASTTLVNLWQHNLHALKAVRWWGCRRLRTSAVARITGAGY